MQLADVGRVDLKVNLRVESERLVERVYRVGVERSSLCFSTGRTKGCRLTMAA